MTFRYPEHAAVAEMLRSMDASYLERARCFFGGDVETVRPERNEAERD